MIQNLLILNQGVWIPFFEFTPKFVFLNGVCKGKQGNLDWFL